MLTHDNTNEYLDSLPDELGLTFNPARTMENAAMRSRLVNPRSPSKRVMSK